MRGVANKTSTGKHSKHTNPARSTDVSETAWDSSPCNRGGAGACDTAGRMGENKDVRMQGKEQTSEENLPTGKVFEGVGGLPDLVSRSSAVYRAIA